MEKSAAKYRKFIFGLLIISINIFPLFAAPSWAYLKSLKFIPMQSYFFTSTDNTFYLEIADCKADDVDFFVNDLPDGVSFVSSSKTTLVVKDSNGRDTRGTRLELTYRFSQNGTCLLPAMTVQVSGKSLKIGFERVSVFENPRFVHPSMSVVFDNEEFNRNGVGPFDIMSGEHVQFTLYVKHTSYISNFTWNIPEDSLFKEVERFEIVNDTYKNTDYSPELIPVATFDWQPLIAKDYKLPVISVSAVGYNGSEVSLDFPNISFRVADGDVKDYHDVQDNIFAYAYSSPEVHEEPQKKVVKAEEIEQLRELRQKERYSLLSLFSIRKQRIELEQSIGLGISDNESNEVIYILLIAASILSFGFAVVFYIIKKGRYGTILMVLFCVSFAFAVVTGIDRNKDYAIYKGGDIYPIPEEGVASSSVVIPLGSRVVILYSIGDWAYIDCNGITGWINKSTVLPLDKKDYSLKQEK